MENKKIKLIVLDVDGTLTDGGVYYDSNGNEFKRFDVKDGLGIRVAQKAGLEFAIITGRESHMVERRTSELGKYPALLNLAKELGCTLEEIAYIGDDLNDLQCMESVGFAACPADAAKQIKSTAHYVSIYKGGYGAVRDILEHLISFLDFSVFAKNIYYCI